jgi:hypothetical protein
LSGHDLLFLFVFLSFLPSFLFLSTDKFNYIIIIYIFILHIVIKYVNIVEWLNRTK